MEGFPTPTSLAGDVVRPRDAQRAAHFSHFSSPSAKERFHVFASEQRKREKGYERLKEVQLTFFSSHVASSCTKRHLVAHPVGTSGGLRSRTRESYRRPRCSLDRMCSFDTLIHNFLESMSPRRRLRAETRGGPFQNGYTHRSIGDCQIRLAAHAMIHQSAFQIVFNISQMKLHELVKRAYSKQYTSK